MVDSRKRLETEACIVCVHLSHVIHHPGEMSNFGDGVLVADTDGRTGPRIWFIDQRQCVPSALSGSIEICDPAPTRYTLPAVLDHDTHAFRGEVLDLVKLLGRADGIAKDANTITMLTEAIAPESASVHGLNPFDLQVADVGGYLLCAR